MNDFLIDLALYHAALVKGSDSQFLIMTAQEFLGIKDEMSVDGRRVMARFQGTGSEWGTAVWQRLWDARPQASVPG